MTNYSADRSKVRRVAPWPDYAGNTIHEGDSLVHPNGDCGKVVFLQFVDSAEDAWQVDYGDGVDRLCLQIGDRGQAVVRRSG